MKQGSRLGDFELLLVLAMVRLGPEAYGAALAREIEERTGRQVSLGAIYKTLERFGSKDLVTSEVGTPLAERGGRRRKYYQLTAAGEQILNRSLQDIDAMRPGLEHALTERSPS